MSGGLEQLELAQRRRRTLATGVFIIAVLTLIAYSRTPAFDFIWDDESYVQNNRLLQGVDGLAKIWLPGNTPQYYPVVFSSFWLEYQLWGLNPTGYHVINVLLHALNALLLWAVCRAIGLPRAASWLIAVIFAVHPVHVESVAWITERKNLLSGLFYLGAAWSYLRFEAIRDDEIPNKPAREAWGFYGAALLLFGGALLSKSVTSSLPAALILVMLWRRKNISIGRLVPLIPMFLVGLVAAANTAIIERELVGAKGADFDFSIIERCLIASRALLFYPLKIIWPHPLIFNYERWTIDAGDMAGYWPLAVIAIFAVILVRLFAKGHRGPFIALAFYAGTILPAIGFFNVYPHVFSFVADHFQYLASIGTIVLLVMLIATRLHDERALLALGGVVVLVLTGLSWRQTGDYRNLETLWTNTIDKNPDAWMPHGNLASLSLRKADDALRAGDAAQVAQHAARARELSERAVLLKPDHPNSLAKLSEALRLQGDYATALGMQRSAIDLIESRFEPGDPRPAILADEYFKLGRLQFLVGSVDAAIESMRRSLDIRPDFIMVHGELGRLLVTQGVIDEAATHFEIVLTRDPENFLSLSTLANILAQQGRYAEADALFDRAVPAALRPQDQIQAAMRHAIFLLQCPDATVRNPLKAVFLAEQVCMATNRSLPNTLDVLALAYAANERFEDAIRVTEEALALARRLGVTDMVAIFETHLALYRRSELPPLARPQSP